VRRGERLLSAVAGVAAAIAAVIAVLAGGLAGPPPAAAQTPAPTAPPAPDAPASAPAPPTITAAGAVLYDVDDGRVLYGVAPEAPRPMASLTKVMTALLALEAGAIDETVTVSAAAAATGRRPGAATLGLDAGQQIPMRSLLAGLMTRSGNDAAVAVAEHIAGGEAAFVEKMNARAAELGLPSTRFVNASGLTDDPAHVASPLDLALLARTAMANPDFAGWAGAEQLIVPGLDPLVNRNELIGTFPGATGVKTGFTNLAGMCLIASAVRDGRTLYAVVLGSEASFADTTELLEHGFSAYRRTAPADPATPTVRYRWPGAEVGLVPEEPLAATLPVTGRATWRTILDPLAQRPVPAGTVLGRAELRVDGAVVDEVALRSDGDVTQEAPGEPGAVIGRALQEALRAFARLEPVERAA